MGNYELHGVKLQVCAIFWNDNFIVDLHPAGLSVHLFESAFLQSLLHWVHHINHPCSFQLLKQHE